MADYDLDGPLWQDRDLASLVPARPLPKTAMGPGAIRAQGRLPRDINLEIICGLLERFEHIEPLGPQRSTRLPQIIWDLGALPDYEVNLHNVVRDQLARGADDGDDLGTLQEFMGPAGNWAIVKPWTMTSDDTWEILGALTGDGIPTSVGGVNLKKGGDEQAFLFGIGNGNIAYSISQSIKLDRPNARRFAYRTVRGMDEFIVTGFIEVTKSQVVQDAPHLAGPLLDSVFQKARALQKKWVLATHRPATVQRPNVEPSAF